MLLWSLFGLVLWALIAAILFSWHGENKRTRLYTSVWTESKNKKAREARARRK